LVVHGPLPVQQRAKNRGADEDGLKQNLNPSPPSPKLKKAQRGQVLVRAALAKKGGEKKKKKGG